ncbi:MAG: CapA family protein [Chloroflexi bacterium]|nr:CapA family protein [Chloroflexota bacterium]
MTGRGIDQILRHPSDPRLHEHSVKDAREYVMLAERANGPIPRGGAPEYIWGDALEIWRERKADLKVVNLETAITSSDEFAPKGINYRMHPDNAAMLTAAGIDICCLANNHVLDWGEHGLRDTIATLERAGVRHAGAGETLAAAQTPAIFETGSDRVLIFSICTESSGVPRSWRTTDKSPGVWLLDSLASDAVSQVREAIEQHRKPGDVVVASIHWGGNWGYAVPQAQVRFAHALIDEVGVDIIHGHSSHHPRPVELYNGRLVFYGCGDFINDYEGIGGYEEFRDDLVFMVFADFDSAPFKLRKLELVPLQIQRFRLQRAAAEDARWMLGCLKAASEPFGTQFELAEEGVIKVNV